MTDLTGPNGFSLIRRLGEGGMGVVYEAVDLKRKERVAVKTLLSFDSATLLRFKNEFRSFASVVHTNLVSLHQLVEFNGQWYLVMELLKGADFKTALRRKADDSKTGGATTPLAADRDKTISISLHRMKLGNDELMRGPFVQPLATGQPVDDLNAARNAFAQLALAVEAIHSAGQLHRDIKPANAFIEPDGRVVLLDFGIALATQQALRGEVDTDVVVGTPRFLAPELLQGGLPSPASDWYAFGVMLFDVLCGVPAFTGSVNDMVTQKLHGAPPSVRARFPFVPPELAELIERLCDPNPLKRPGFEAILTALDHRDWISKTQRVSLSDDLVGRGEELSTLRDVAREARFAPRAALISGRSGVGKTALLNRVLHDLEHDGATILRGRCYEHETVPFKTVDRIVDALAALIGRDAVLREALRPTDTDSLVRAFPVLRDVWGVDSASDAAVDWKWVKYRALTALAEVLRRLAQRCRLVCVVDDLQWGDAESTTVLSSLCEALGSPLLLLCTYREEESNSSAVQELERRVLAKANEGAPIGVLMRVQPLSDEECRTLAQRIAAEANVTDERVLEWARVGSGGQPYFLHEMIFYAAGADPAQVVQGGVTLKDVLEQRVARLAAETRRVLKAIALSPSGIPVGVAEKAGDVSAPRRAVGELRAAHLVRTFTDGEHESVDVFHDKVREIVIATCSAEETRQVHASLFHAWKQGPESQVQVLAVARHALAAGGELTTEEVCPALIAAARIADRAYDVYEVRRLLVSVRERSAGRAVTAEVSLMLGNASLVIGDVDEANRCFNSTLAAAAEPVIRAQARFGLARLALGQLETQTILDQCSRALTELDLTTIRPGAVAFLGAVIRWASTWLLYRFFPVQPKPRKTDGLAASIHWVGSYAGYFLLKPTIFVQGLFRAYPIIRRLGSGRHAAEWYAATASIACIFGMKKLGPKLVARSLVLADEVKDPASRAFAEAMRFLGIDMLGETVEAEAYGREALKSAARWLDNGDYLTLVAGYEWSFITRGLVQEGLTVMEAAFDRLQRLGGASVLTEGHTFRCYAGPLMAMLGRVEDGTQQLDKYEAFVRTHAASDAWRNIQIIAHRAFHAQLSGAPDEVIEALFAKHAEMRLKPRNHAHQLRHIFIAKLYRRLDQAMRANAGPAARKALADALREVKPIIRHPTMKAHWLICYGGLLWLEGKSPARTWDDVLEIARVSNNPWAEFEVNVLRAKTGAAAEAKPFAERAVMLAHKYGWRLFEKRAAALLERCAVPD